MRAALLAAILLLAAAPLALPPADATRCTFPVEELRGPVCMVVLGALCTTQDAHAGDAKGALACWLP